MKAKTITLSVLAALYASGVSAAANDLAAPKHSYKNIELTEQVVAINQAIKNGHERSSVSVNRPTTNGKNVHRNLGVSKQDKVPFNFQQDDEGEHLYIVELVDQPAATYQGGIKGLSATTPRANAVPSLLAKKGTQGKLDINSAAVKSYKQYLSGKRASMLSAIESSVGKSLTVQEEYSLAFNGFSAKMTQNQAAQIASLPGVRQVVKDKLYQLHTDVGPQHIGADQLWTGTVGTKEFKGEGIVVGVIDTGINSDHPSFAEVAGDGYVHSMPDRYADYLGDCAEEDFADMCNDKLIGIRSYSIITDSFSDYVFPSRRPANGEDYNGHGSHTASTAAGNTLFDVEHVVPVLAEQSDGDPTGLVFPQISGVAPRANIIAYQVCYPGDRTYGDSYGGCPSSALIASIEDAIEDGVDVINFSIGSQYGSVPWDEPVELSFLSAREAGISVAASAGNAYNPEVASQARGAIDHLSPWLTSVAATTHSRDIVVEDKMITDFSGGDETPMNFVGGGITESYSGPVVLADDYGWQYEMCNEPFPAGFFDNDPDGNPFDVAPIVICKRGEVARVAKASNVAAGGAGGFILYNSKSSEEVVNDAFAIPGIHISYGTFQGDESNNYVGLSDWLRNGSDHRATITASNVTTANVAANYVADFSSRGPNLVNPDVMSPNLAAPGVNVYAAWADDMPFTLVPHTADYAAISGTSMAAPHVAGAMALLTQAHPSWTPAQIQSALMTTASIEGVTRRLDGFADGITEAGYNDAGSGVINVARATRVGLLLDETAENYRAAEPNNGGDVTTLNVPYMFDDSCQQSCTWMRTFSATTDGTWEVSAQTVAMEGADMLGLEVTPKSFTLKAGETQAISVTASILEVDATNADASQLQLFGRVDLTPQASSLPAQYLPVGVRYQANDLPKSISANIHRSQGHVVTPEINTDEIQQLNSVVYGLAKAEKFEWKLKAVTPDLVVYKGNDEFDAVTMEDINASDGVNAIFFDVPEGTKRLIWEVTHIEENHAYTAIDLGRDLNNDGEIQWTDEALCYSYTDFGDFCAVNDPEPGRYWAIAANRKYDYEDPTNNADSFELSLAMVMAQDESNLTVNTGVDFDGTSAFKLALNYHLSDAQAGDVYYGLVAIGSDEYNAENLGTFPVKLTHQGDDIVIESSQTAAKVGDKVDYKVTLVPNLYSYDRDFTLTTTIPDLLNLDADSVKVVGLGDYEAGLNVEGNTITITATQPSGADIARHYVFTTNADDEQCKVPYGDNPNFFDLGLDGALPMDGIQGNANSIVSFPLSTLGLPHVPLYGNSEKDAWDFLSISPFGYVQFDPLRDLFNSPVPFDNDFQRFPDTMIAPYWRGEVGMYVDPEFDNEKGKYKHVVYAVIMDEGDYIFQWDGGLEHPMAFFRIPGRNADPNAYYNVQTIVSTENSFLPNDYEIIFAYDALQSANADLGSVGLHGFFGERGGYGPYNGYLNDGFAFNDVDVKVPEGSVICADYRGPEQTQLDLSFTVEVSADIIGQSVDISVESQFAESDLVVNTASLSAPSNISVGQMSDLTVAENTSLEGIAIIYNDIKGTANGIEVTGEHFSVVVDGNTSGSTMTITPDAHWHGETQVTVTVYDLAYPSDKDSMTFNLTVTSDGIEFGCTDSSATNYDENANTDNGTCQYQSASKPSTPAKNTNSGGSYGWMMLLVLSLFAARKTLKSK